MSVRRGWPITRLRWQLRLFLLLVLAFSLSGLCAADTTDQEAPQTRAWLWRFVAGGRTVGSGAFDTDGRCYFAADDRYLYALDRNGTMIWRTDLGRRPGGTVAIGVDGTLFVTLDNGELVALNRDGRLIWRATVSSGTPLAPVILSNGMIITVRSPSTIEARSHTGRLIWETDVDSKVTCAPIAGPAGDIVVATADGALVSLAPDGRLLKRRYIGEVASVVAARDGGIAVGSTGGHLVATNETLEPLWRVDLGSAVRELRAADSGDYYVTLDDGALTRVTAGGLQAWNVKPGSAAVRTPLVGNDLVYVTTDGLLTRMGRDGSAQWQMRLLDRPLDVEATGYGALVVPTAGWVTYAYAVQFAPAGAWPQERGSLDRRGVAAGGDRGRVDMSAYQGTADYLALRLMLLAGGQSAQGVAMARIAARVSNDENLAGEYGYLIELCEDVAGSPYFGPLDQFGPHSASRRAREEAVFVLGQIGDLASGRFLAKLLTYEPDTAMQASVLESMGRLGTPIDASLVSRLQDIVRRDLARGTSNALGQAICRFVGAIDAYRGGYVEPGIANVLLLIASSNYSRQTRTLALDTARELAGGRTP